MVKDMEYKRINWAFLAFLGLELALVIYLVAFGSWINLSNVLVETLLAESTIVIPPAIVLAFGHYEEGILKRLGFCLMRPMTLLAVFLYGICIMPIGTLANAISMLWVDNEVLEASGMMLDAPWYMTVLSSAILAPIIEEFAFRGFMYRGYRRCGGKLSAVIVSAAAFAFMHLNFNQAAYAFVVGVAFAFIVEATGSVWSSILCHFMFNFESVVVMLIGNWLTPGLYDDISVDRSEILDSLPEYIVAAAIATVLAVFVLAWAAKLQNRTDYIKRMFDNEEEKGKNIITASIIVAFILCLAYMIFNVITI